MLGDILEESWVYKETIAKGKKEGFGEALLQIVEIRFPTLLAQAKLAVEQKKSVKQLQKMLNKICRANTIEEAQAILLPNE